MPSQIIDTLAGLKDELRTLPSKKFNELRNAYRYLWIKRFLKRNGILNLVLGTLTIYLSLSASRFTPLRAGQTAIGVVTVGVSLLALYRPSVSGIFRFGILFAVAALWNSGIAALSRDFTSIYFLIMLVLLQIYSAFFCFRIYQRNKTIDFQEPSPSIQEQYQELWQLVRSIVPQESTDPSVLMLHEARGDWRGIYEGDRAMLAHTKRNVLIVGNASDFTFEPVSHQPLPAERQLGMLKYDTVASKSTIRNQIYSNFLKWKNTANTIPSTI